jgi:adenine-specific DNA-methyltransferase
MQRNKNLGQTFTPEIVVKFMLNEIAYTGKGKIIDNSCGNGAFLQEIAKIILSKDTKEFANLYRFSASKFRSIIF